MPVARSLVLALLSLAPLGCGGDGPYGVDAPDPQQARCTQDFGDPAGSPHTLPWRAGTSHTLIQGYCPPNPRWGHHGWIAYDFDMAIGDTILATRDGTVLFARDSFPDGTRDCAETNWVFVRHADGTVMQYAHMTRDGVLVEVGEPVRAGEPIALSGDSGCSTGPHLHLALFRDRTGFDADDTVPLNFRNAEGPHDERGGLVQDATYRARTSTGAAR